MSMHASTIIYNIGIPNLATTDRISYVEMLPIKSKRKHGRKEECMNEQNIIKYCYRSNNCLQNKINSVKKKYSWRFREKRRILEQQSLSPLKKGALFSYYSLMRLWKPMQKQPMLVVGASFLWAAAFNKITKNGLRTKFSGLIWLKSLSFHSV